MVISKESTAPLNEPIAIALCAQVTEIPDKINKQVLNKGNSNTSIGNTPSGGNTDPNSIAGFKAALKNAQKKPKNNIISEIINKIKPKRSPSLTAFV